MKKIKIKENFNLFKLSKEEIIVFSKRFDKLLKLNDSSYSILLNEYQKKHIKKQNQKLLKKKYAQFIKFSFNLKNEFNFLSIKNVNYFNNKLNKLDFFIEKEKFIIKKSKKSENHKKIQEEFLEKLMIEINIENLKNQVKKIQEKPKKKKIISDITTVIATTTSCIPVIGQITAGIKSTTNCLSATDSLLNLTEINKEFKEKVKSKVKTFSLM